MEKRAECLSEEWRKKRDEAMEAGYEAALRPRDVDHDVRGKDQDQ